jgi:DNA polymerase-3 subunit delta'
VSTIIRRVLQQVYQPARDAKTETVISKFYGNAQVVVTLQGMVERRRIPQTILLGGPAGVGKATLARRFAAELIGGREKIEKDDLSTPENLTIVSEREKWPSEKRVEDPMLFSTHPDFVTFPPDGPLRQISIQQMRLLKERSQFKPLRGDWRVFLIDRIDRANEQAANSLLKVLEEPPPHLIVIMTAENPYDLLPTIRSRAVQFHLGRLDDGEMRSFIAERGLDAPERRLALASGSPGMAVSFDLETYDQRRSAMLKLLQVGAGRAPFAEWTKVAEPISARKTEKLDYYLDVLFVLLEDLVLLQHGSVEIRNFDVRAELESLSARVSFEWIRHAVVKMDELVEFLRRNIQKGIALDAFALELRTSNG